MLFSRLLGRELANKEAACMYGVLFYFVYGPFQHTAADREPFYLDYEDV
jgi:hypothetical protein